MFASCLYDKFACAAWSDPGIVFDETKGDTSTIGNLGILAITLRPGKIPGTKTDILKQKEFIRSYVKMGMIYMKFMHLWLPALFLFPEASLTDLKDGYL